MVKVPSGAAPVAGASYDGTKPAAQPPKAPPPSKEEPKLGPAGTVALSNDAKPGTKELANDAGVFPANYWAKASGTETERGAQVLENSAENLKAKYPNASQEVNTYLDRSDITDVLKAVGKGDAQAIREAVTARLDKMLAKSNLPSDLRAKVEAAKAAIASESNPAAMVDVAVGLLAQVGAKTVEQYGGG